MNSNATAKFKLIHYRTNTGIDTAKTRIGKRIAELVDDDEEIRKVRGLACRSLNPFDLADHLKSAARRLYAFANDVAELCTAGDEFRFRYRDALRCFGQPAR